VTAVGEAERGPPMPGRPDGAEPPAPAGWPPPVPAPHPGWLPPPWHRPPWHRPPWHRPPPAGRLPWPVVVLVALVTGLVGGVIGALSVGQSRGVDDLAAPQQPAPVAPALADPVPAPLPAGGSIARVASVTLPSVVQITARGGGAEATGSGFVLDRRGHVLTNNHVVEEASDDGRIVVVFDDERRVRASVVGRSAAYDVAVLQLARDTVHRPAARADLTQLRVGETVVAIGAPLGLSSTVTSGIVSALDRPVTVGGTGDVSYINAIQTDAAINPGNSGGPLVNLRGEVVGVNSAIATLGGPFGGGSGSIGVGFAIPIDQVLRTAQQILATGKASYPVIGASVDVERRSGGARLIDVTAGGPADRAGLRDGDVVTRMDGQGVDDGIELIVGIRSHLPGQVVSLVYRRDGEPQTARVRLGEEQG
jgi:putative serine protease PepD